MQRHHFIHHVRPDTMNDEVPVAAFPGEQALIGYPFQEFGVVHKVETIPEKQTEPETPRHKVTGQKPGQPGRGHLDAACGRQERQPEASSLENPEGEVGGNRVPPGTCQEEDW